MMKGKTHYRYSDHESMCGLDFTDNKNRIIDSIENVTCGTCKRIVTVHKSDSYNRPKKNIAKCVDNNKNNVYVRNNISQYTDATNNESKTHSR